MTVDELFETLVKLRAEGQGSLPVTLAQHYDDALGAGVHAAKASVQALKYFHDDKPVMALYIDDGNGEGIVGWPE